MPRRQGRDERAAAISVLIRPGRSGEGASRGLAISVEAGIIPVCSPELLERSRAAGRFSLYLKLHDSAHGARPPG